MRIFLTGATGYIGSAIAEALLAAGHSVVGAARSAAAEEKVMAAGMAPLRADLTSPATLAHGCHSCDAVIHTGTTNNGVVDTAAVAAMLEVLGGSNKPFVYTSGIWVLGNTGDDASDESATLHPPAIVAWRPAVEQLVLASASSGVKGVVIRPGMVYGRGGGMAGLFLQSAAQLQAAEYVGDGNNRWAMVDVDDLADLYIRVLEKASAGSLFHGVDGPSFKTRDIAEAAAFGADLGGKAVSLPVDRAEARYGPLLVEAMLLDQVASGDKARRELGWSPQAVSFLEDLRFGSYAMVRINP